MSAPFVISMKFVGEPASLVAANDTVRQGLDKLGRSLDAQRVKAVELQNTLAARVNVGLNVRDDFDSSARAADIAAYGSELDGLRAKFNPLFAAEQRHRQAVEEINRAHRVGAIDAEEMAAALLREKSAYDTLTQSINATHSAQMSPGARSANTANIAAQFQDIGVTTAMGMDPLQIALQQGTQLSAVLGPMGTTGVVKGLAAAFMSIVSPVSLITIGVIAAGAAGIQWLMSLKTNVKTADEALKEHADILGRIKTGYGDALKGAEDYARESPALLGALTRMSTAQLETNLREAREKFSNFTSVLFADADGIYRDNFRTKKQFSPFSEEIETLRRQMADGKPDFDAFYASINAKVDADGTLRKVGDELISSTEEARNLSIALAESGRNATILKDQVLATHAALAAMPTTSNLQFALDSRVEGERSAEKHKLEMDAINAKAPAQLADIARRRAAIDLDGEAITEAVKRQKIEEAGALAYAQAVRGIAQADEARLRAANDNISAAQLDLELIGQSIGETERLRFVRQNLAAAEAEAARSGTTVSAAYRAEIERLGEAYGRLQSNIAISKLSDDLMFERAQLGRSSLEQQIASTLRPIFGEDLTSSQAQFLAQQMRVNQTLTDMKDIGTDLTRGFLSDLRTSLMSGSSLFEALGNAGVNALDKIAQRALGLAADGFIDMIFGSLLGGGGLTPKPVTNIGFGSYGSFDTGGWTGGRAGKPAGVVHGEEFVVRAGPAAANRAALEALNAGGSLGGFGGFNFSPVSYFSFGGGGGGDQAAAFQQMLDERDARLNAQFQDAIAAYVANPMRRAA